MSHANLQTAGQERLSRRRVSASALARDCYVRDATRKPGVALLGAVQDIYSTLRLPKELEISKKQAVFDHVRSGNLVAAAIAALPPGTTLVIEDVQIELLRGSRRVIAPRIEASLDRAIIAAMFELMELGGERTV